MPVAKLNQALDHLILQSLLVRAFARHCWYAVLWGAGRPDPKRVMWVDAGGIRFKKEPIFGGARKYGTNVSAGAWDLQVRDDVVDYDHLGPKCEGLIRVEAFALYKAIEQMVQDGMAWEETTLFQDRLRFGRQSVEGLEREGRRIRELLASVRKHGLVPQSVLRQGRSKVREFLLPAAYGEIRVAIGRSGEIFLEDGVHRFFIARALGISSIPVQVILRHQLWQETRVKIRKEWETGVSSGEDRRLDHPDLLWRSRERKWRLGA